MVITNPEVRTQLQRLTTTTAEAGCGGVCRKQTNERQNEEDQEFRSASADPVCKNNNKTYSIIKSNFYTFRLNEGRSDGPGNKGICPKPDDLRLILGTHEVDRTDC